VSIFKLISTELFWPYLFPVLVFLCPYHCTILCNHYISWYVNLEVQSVNFISYFRFCEYHVIQL
jgi:hypothetical protein